MSTADEITRADVDAVSDAINRIPILLAGGLMALAAKLERMRVAADKSRAEWKKAAEERAYPYQMLNAMAADGLKTIEREQAKALGMKDFMINGYTTAPPPKSPAADTKPWGSFVYKEITREDIRAVNDAATQSSVILASVLDALALKLLRIKDAQAREVLERARAESQSKKKAEADRRCGTCKWFDCGIRIMTWVCRINRPAVGEYPWPIIDKDDYCGEWAAKGGAT